MKGRLGWVVCALFLSGVAAALGAGSAGAAAAGNGPAPLYAYADGTAPPAAVNDFCQESLTLETTLGCSLAAALKNVTAGGTVYLGTPSSVGRYVGNWTVDTSVTIEPVTGSGGATLSGNNGRAAGCTTPGVGCDGPVISVASTAGAPVNLDLTDVTVADANTAAGGAIRSQTDGSLTITGSTFAGNAGGAIADLAATSTLSVDSSTFTGNSGSNAGSNGGAIVDLAASGTLLVNSSAFTDNSAGNGKGGAIYADATGSASQSLSVHITNSTFAGNTGSSGGAIDATSSDPGTVDLDISGSGFSGNAAIDGDGGAIDLADASGQGTATVAGSTFSANSASIDGGAIDIGDNELSGGSGTLTVAGATTFDGNSAVDGGAIDDHDNSLTATGSVTVTGATFADNFASGDGGAIDHADHGAATGFASVLTVGSSTFSANGAMLDGGALDTNDGGGPGRAQITASTFSGDSAAKGSEIADTSGVANPADVSVSVIAGSCVAGDGFQGGGFNATSDPSCRGPGGPTDPPSDAQLAATLGPLAHNGGPTLTMALEPGNPAIGIVPAGLCPTSDERGVPLAGGPHCDAGAVQTPTPLTVAVPSTTITYGQSPALTPAYAGFVLGQTFSSLGAPATCTTDRPVSGAGTYTVVCDGADNAITDTAAAPDTDYAFTYPATTLVVEKADQTITFALPSPNPVVGGAFTFTSGSATATSGLAVTFSVDPSTAEACAIPPGGATVTFQHAGSCVIDANQSGNDNYNPAPPQQQRITVASAAQAITFTSAPPAGMTVGASFTPQASGGGSGNPVVLSIGPTAQPVCSLDPGGHTVTLDHAGTCVIDAGQAGNGDYAAAPMQQETVGVGPGTQTITFTSNPPRGPTVGGSYPALLASATSGLRVTFSIDSSTPRTCSLDSYEVTVAFNHAGRCVIDANQSGGADYTAAAETQQAFTIGRAPQQIMFAPPPGNPTVGSAFNLTATGGASGNPIEFTIGAATTGSACSIGNGATVTFEHPGTCVIDAAQAGNNDYFPATPRSESIAVQARPSPGARLYWADFQTGAIRVENSDGSVGTLFGGESNPTGVAIDPATGTIYWSDAGSGEIRVGHLDGHGAPRVLFAGESAPTGVAIDPTHRTIFWTDYDTNWNVSQPGTVRMGTLTRSGWSATRPATTLFSGQHEPLGVTLDPQHDRVYWSVGSGEIKVGTLERSRTAAAGPPALLFGGQSKPSGLAFDSATRTLFWSDNGDGTIMLGRIDTAGTHSQGRPSWAFRREDSDPFGIAFDPITDRLFWSDYNHRHSNRNPGSIRDGMIATRSIQATTDFPRESGPAFLALLHSPTAAGRPIVARLSATSPILTCSPGEWAGDVPGAFFYRAPRTLSYTWSMNRVPIANPGSRTLTPRQPGAYTCTVTASNAAGSAAQTSDAVTVTPAAPAQ